MKRNKKRKWIQSAMELLLGLVCVLVMGIVFYGAMAYQLGADVQKEKPEAQISADALLALPGAQLISEQTQEQEMGGQRCTVTVRLYRADSGLEIEAVSAAPAAYIERLSQEKWTAQPVTGFSLAGLDAVYSVRGEEGMLSCRSGERIFMLRAGADERTLYTLGAGACLE